MHIYNRATEAAFTNFVVCAKSNFTREECLSIERTSSVRRSAKIVSAVENNPAYLHCSIGNNGQSSSDFLVAWTRLKDDVLLTAGSRAFTSDTRFQISPKRQTHDWVLLVRRVQSSDEGCYLCEINTEPLSTLIPVYLSVIPIQETPKKLYAVNTLPKRTSKLVAQMDGDFIVLNCTISTPLTAEFIVNNEDNVKSSTSNRSEYDEYKLQQQQTFADVLWTKDNKFIELSDKFKYEIKVKIAPNGAIINTLRIAKITTDDDGLYACEGEHFIKSAQMIHVNASNSSSSSSQQYFIKYILILIYLLNIYF